MTRTLAICLLAAALFAGFAALGTWQVERRSWKLDLIARVESRVHSVPEAPPPRERWSATGRDDEYRHVGLGGRYEHARETLVQAVTARGPGWWVLTPLMLADGTTVLVNRGFVDDAHRDPASRHAKNDEGDAAQIVTGLLRLSEPHGGFLRANDPVADHWYSRDVAAIGAARRIPAAQLAPYFVDADAAPDASAWPVGGMTVVRFHNSHLVYAATWYTLALMSVVGGWIAIRQKSRP